MTVAISIAVVDDHPLLREGVISSLEATGRFRVVAQGSTCDDAIRISAAERPDILLMDLSMPGGGNAAIGPILSANPTQKIVVLTVSEAADDVAAALRAGVKGYILKGIGARSLAEALVMIASGETYVTPTLSARLLSDLTQGEAVGNPLATLTERELEVLQLVSNGLSNKQIALRLSLQEKTVKHHMSRVLAKLKAQNRTEAAMIAAGSGGMENHHLPIRR